MKMKKINRIFICFFVYLMCFININAEYLADIIGGKIYLSEPVVEGITSRVKFSVRLRVEPSGENTTKQQHIDLKEWKWGDISNSFITVENLKNESGSSNKVFFKEKGETLEAVEFTLSGSFLFDWNNKDKFGNRVKIGEMYSGNGNGNNSFLGNVYLNLGKDDIEIVSSLGVKVLQDMDFGTIIAGTTGDTHTSGNPAKVEAKGLMDSDVKIIIPQNTLITNERNEFLTVALSFEEKEKILAEGNNQSTVRKVKNKIGERNVGTTDEVAIHGRVKTSKNSKGIYTGEFKVRVEYDY